MINYQYRTRKELIEWQSKHPIQSGDSLSDMHLDYFTNCDMDSIVAVIALEGNKIVGRNLITYCRLLVNGELIDCIVSQNVFVGEVYRKLGVGVYLKMHVLKLGMPQLSSGVSRSMQMVYDKWSEFKRIDASPLYLTPLDYRGIIRIGRLAYYRLNEVKSDKIQGFLQLYNQWKNCRKLARGSKSLVPLSVGDALQSLESTLDSKRYSVQVPWNLEKLKNALIGVDPSTYAWILSETKGGNTSLYLITIYLKSRRIRILSNKLVEITEAHLNEIFPPLYDCNGAMELLRFSARKAKRLGASSLQISAATPQLKEVCINLNLQNFENKTIYLVPKGVNKEHEEIMSNPDNWWCRALNEVQFEETHKNALIFPSGKPT